MLPNALLFSPVPDFLLTPLREVAACHDHFQAPDKESLIQEVGASIRALVMNGGDAVSEAFLDRLPKLELIAVHGVGYDGVPVAYCRARGIHVTNTPDVLTDDVADIAVALVLMTSRRLTEAARFLRAGDWQKGAFPLAHALRGKTAGILGLGRIGRAIASRLEGHGLNIAYHGRQPQAVPYRYFAELTELAAASDFLIVACPGGAATRHLVDASVLEALGPKGILINIARGSVVDQQALMEALEHERLRGAGLDVFEQEPHVPIELATHPRVVALPHIGSATHETRRAMAALVVANVSAHFAGQPLPSPVG
jgi:hydroxypyruvate reductase